LDRLTQFNAGVTGATTAATGLALLPTETFTYDGIGNRKSRTTQAPGATSTQATNYTHGNSATTPINHWLTNSTGQLPNAYTYDASGNTLTESNALAAMNPTTGQLNATTGTPVTSALAYTYDAKNRLTKVQIGATTTDTVTYKINAMGQRVQKIGAGLYAPSTTATINATTGQSPQGISLNFNARYVYDEQGRIIGEYANDGKLISETIWFNDLPSAATPPRTKSTSISTTFTPIIWARRESSPGVLPSVQQRLVRTRLTNKCGARIRIRLVRHWVIQRRMRIRSWLRGLRHKYKPQPSGRTFGSRGSCLITKRARVTIGIVSMIQRVGGIRRVIRLGCGAALTHSDMLVSRQ
jgi:hypothetical protein